MTSDNGADELAIHKVIAALEAGWNAGDGSTFAASFAEDADYVIIDGHYIKGRQAIAQGHQRIFDMIYRDSHNVATVHQIRFIGDDVGIAHVEWRLTFQQDEAVHNARAMSTIVMIKAHGTWSIAAFQNTSVVSP